MQVLSSIKNQQRWKPEVKLRAGQKALYDIVSTKQKDRYCIQLPTGYGKSWCACIAYGVMRDQGRVNRLLIVVPTDQQRTQYIDGLYEDLEILGLKTRGIYRCDNRAGWIAKESNQNKGEIFVAGVQSICADPGYYADLMSKNRWLVVADEFHHYGSENSWGKSILELPYSVIMGMSATPVRSDQKLTIFGDSDFDVTVTIPDAYLEKAVKRIQGRVGNWMVSYSTADDPEPQNFTTKDLIDAYGVNGTSPASISAYEIKKGIRYHDKYVSEIFLQVLELWNQYEAKWPKQNQILVFAMSCRHADMVAKLINDIAFPGYPKPFADWIGVGEGLAGNRSDSENKKILAQFQANELPCLVQVNKAGEGFNNKRCSIGLFLDLVGDTPTKRQHIGRFMRVNPAAPGQSSVIFVSEDSPAKFLLENIAEEFGSSPDSENPQGKTGGGGGVSNVTIPDVFILDTEFESERIVYPYGSPEKAMEQYIKNFSEDIRQAYAALPHDTALEAFKSMVEPWLKEEHKRNHPPLTEEQKRKQIADQVKRNVGQVAGIVCRKRYGKSHPKTALIDFMKLINSQWKRDHGIGHSDMTADELMAKNKWLQDLAENVNKGMIPTWLSI